MDDFDVHAARAGDVDRLVHRFEHVIRFVAPPKPLDSTFHYTFPLPLPNRPPCSFESSRLGGFDRRRFASSARRRCVSDSPAAIDRTVESNSFAARP
jgi:hypothetical protein